MSESEMGHSDVALRLRAVHERIARAAEGAGRDPGGISLVAVSKTVPVARVIELAEAGQRVFGENRVQEAKEKVSGAASALGTEALSWRLIGHLQRNKTRAALELFEWIDGADSLRLLEALDAQAALRGARARVLLQFNCSGEPTKSGFSPEVWEEVADHLPRLAHVEVGGLMTLGPLAADPEAARPAFRRLRELRDALAGRTGLPLAELSMGMSGDLEIGVEEGATLVRVGTALFGPRTG